MGRETLWEGSWEKPFSCLIRRTAELSTEEYRARPQAELTGRVLGLPFVFVKFQLVPSVHPLSPFSCPSPTAHSSTHPEGFNMVPRLPVTAALAAFASSTAALYINGSVIAPCDSPLYCQGEILHAIELARPFSDSKTFVDM